MNNTYTHDQLMDIVNMVVAGIRTGDNGDDRVYPLAEVARRTGWALTSLEEETRNGTLEHTGKGRSVGMTSRQIALAVTKYRRGKTDLQQPAAADELAQVRAASQRAADRQRPHPRRQKAIA